MHKALVSVITSYYSRAYALERMASGARRPIVLFPAHGASKRKASAIAAR